MNDDDALALRPTHNCFNDAIDYVMAELHAGNKKARHYTIVHAICLVPGTKDEKWSHAWCDDGEYVLEGYFWNKERVWLATPRQEFEEQMRIVKAIRYSVRQWSELNYKHEHFGPWDEEIRALCTDVTGEPARVWKRSFDATFTDTPEDT